MAKIIKRFSMIVVFLCLSLFVIHKLTFDTWVYYLPNNYKIIKKSNGSVCLMVEIDNKNYTWYEDKQVGLNDYVIEFQYNDNYVGVKTLKVENEETIISYYLIDTIEKEVRGPYSNEESYLASVGVWSKDVLNSWKSTTDIKN